MMQDMVPHKNTTGVHDVPVRKVAPKKEVMREGEKFFQKKESLKPEKPKAVRWSFGAEAPRRFQPSLKLAVFLTIVILSAIILGGLKVFGKVNIEIIPRQEFFEVDTIVKAAHSAESLIALETLRFESKLEKSAGVTGTQQVNKSASGRIVIYNAFSSQPQVLVRRTRFETPDGKIYRVRENVTVPGADVSSGQLKPSSIEADVIADAGGEGYNIGLTDFTIPGFKGTARYDKFYARSKTAMSGGFSGVSAVVTKSDKDSLEENLKRELNDALLAQVRGELPSGFIIPENGTIFTIENVKYSHEIGDPAESISITIEASISAFALSLEDIEKSIINKYILDKNSDSAASGIKLENIVSLSYMAKKLSFVEKTLDLKISGQAQATWLFDEQKLKNDLISSPRKSRLEVFNNYSEIARAQITFSPSWWRIFPKNQQKINVYIKISQ